MTLLQELLEMFDKSPENIISTDLRTTGSVLLNSGIECLAATLGVPVEREPAEDGDYAFLVVRHGSVEILQIDEEYTPEDGE